MTQPLRIALAGLGTVGVGLVRILQNQADLVGARAGREIVLTAVSARSRSRDRGVDLSAYQWEDDPVALARREDVDVLVEVMGGEDGPAKAATEVALANGLSVVTANKAMMARHGTALAQSAEMNGVQLRFEAGVAGGIPVVKALTEGMAANVMTRVLGVMNGTCNYILTEMERTGGDYADILADAQRLGYAEADPSFDVGGADAAQKLALLAATAFGTQVDYEGIELEGIEQVTLTDIRYAIDLGFRIKLLGVASRTDTGVEQRMQPCLVPTNSALGQLESVSNMIVLEGKGIGQTVYQGPGAGEGPTASAVVADLVDLARGQMGCALPAAVTPAARADVQARSGAYYVRFTVIDRPGVMADIT
ncbi:MAG: homoserine dehydrogenase, partial [Pseudomonadota bacterium]